MGADKDKKPEPKSEEENLKVAVRVRPFNKREIGRKAKCIVAMNGNTTIITNPEDKEEKKFSFDHSYWSFDGFKEESDGYHKPATPKFTDQRKVFDDIGRGILKNAWAGFNSSLFAYGQTGSGKSWSVIGYGANKGIVPMFCEELFKGITKDGVKDTTYEVKFSMLEIYNEVPRDLLDPKAGSKRSGLKIRQHPKKGFYADGLKECLVSSYEEINERMEEGTVNRTVASTNMNATSSRAHTIVGIHFIQKSKNSAGKEMAKAAVVNLVDLAGSERVESTGATGDRLKEGAAINQSLSMLGNVIHALAEQSEGKKTRVPYRDSALTRLLQNSLGGNCKTAMIAAISPADINYDESLSTLRYADRAKQIKTRATVNEDPVEAMLRELKEENEKLKSQLQGNMVTDSASSVSKDDQEKELREEMEAQLAKNNAEMEEMKMSYEEKLKAAQKSAAVVHDSKVKKEKDKQTKPHIFNLNSNMQLNGMLVNIFEKPETTVGKTGKNEPVPDIIMEGPGIKNNHGIFMLDSKTGEVRLKQSDPENRILVNGDAIKDEVTLKHNDRLIFGVTQFWAFQNPREPGINKNTYPPVTYDYAQQESAAKAGIDLGEGEELAGLREDILEVMSAAQEANLISMELDKRVQFEFVIVPSMDERKAPEICVKMKHLDHKTEFVWTKEKFMNRLCLMKEMYQNYEDNENAEQEIQPEHEDDGFQQDPDEEVVIGYSSCVLQPIAYMVDMAEQLEIIGKFGNKKIGIMNVELVPCDANGKEYTPADDKFVNEPTELVGREVSFCFKIKNCRGIPNSYTDVHCTYKIYLDEQEYSTDKISLNGNPDFNYCNVFTFKPATKQLVEYLETKSLIVQLKGKQNVRKSAVARNKGVHTKDMVGKDRALFTKSSTNMGLFKVNGRVVDPQKQSILVELLLTKKTQARLQKKVDHLKQMLERAEHLNRPRISTDVVKNVYAATTDDQFNSAMKQLEADTDPGDDNKPSPMTNGGPNGGPNGGSATCIIL